MIIGSISSGCAFELLAFFCAKVIIVAIATTECYGTFEEGNHMKLRTSIPSSIYTEISGVFPQGFTSQDPSQGSISLANKGYMSMERAMCAVRVCAFPKIIGVSPSSFLTMCARDTLGEPTEICINWVVDLDFPDTYMKFSAFTKQFACAAISAELWAIFSAFC